MKSPIILTVMLLYSISLHCQKKIKFTEIPAETDTLLVYFSHDRAINANYYKVIRAVINPLTPCLIVHTEEELKAKIKSPVIYSYFGVSETNFTSTTTHSTGAGQMTTTDVLNNYYLTYFHKTGKGYSLRQKRKLIFLKDNRFFDVDLNNFFSLDSFSPQISPVHIAAFLRCNEEIPYNEDVFKDIGKIASDTLFFPEITFNRYRPQAYGVLKNKKKPDVTQYYEYNKMLVETNDDLTELFLNRYNKRKSMYLYDCVRDGTHLYYLIIDVVKGTYVYIDVDKTGYNQGKWHFRRMSKRIGGG